jgi:hypothetical protein
MAHSGASASIPGETEATVSARPSSVMMARDPEVLQTMLDFYAWPTARVLDVTANRRRMWKGVVHSGEILFGDIDPEMEPDIICDFRDVPMQSASVDVIVFDPPHLPVAAASAASDQDFVGRYGLAQSFKADNIAEYFPPFLTEAARLLRPEGLVFVKLKDFVHNHKYQWMLAAFINAVEAQDGLTACDLIVKRDPSAGNMMSGRWQKAHHARNAHCWWIVVRKGRCESRRAA